MIDKSIIPECYTDTSLLETIVPPENPKKGYNHQKGCPNVAKVMKEKLTDDFALGIIDADKKRIKYLDEFTILAKTENLIVHKHANKPHYIIEIVPAIEQFILDCAKKQSVTLVDYGLPNTLKEFCHHTKQQASKNDPKLKQLFQALKHSSGIIIFKELVCYLKESRREATENKLKEICSNSRLRK